MHASSSTLPSSARQRWFISRGVCRCTWLPFGGPCDAHSCLTRAPRSLTDRAEAMAGELSLQHVTNIIWAYSSLKWSTPSLMTVLVAGARLLLA